MQALRTRLAGKNVFLTEALVKARRTKGIVLAAFLGIGEHGIGLTDFLEFFFRHLVARIFVRVIPEGKLPVGLLDLSRSGAFGEAQSFVVVSLLFIHGVHRWEKNTGKYSASIRTMPASARAGYFFRLLPWRRPLSAAWSRPCSLASTRSRVFLGWFSMIT